MKTRRVLARENHFCRRQRAIVEEICYLRRLYLCRQNREVGLVIIFTVTFPFFSDPSPLNLIHQLFRILISLTVKYTFTQRIFHKWRGKKEAKK